MADLNKSRCSNIHGSMSSMYYADSCKIWQSRFIRMESQYYPDSVDKTKSLTNQNFNAQVQISSFTAWTLLFTSILFSALVPCWLLADARSQPLTRNSWRYFTVSILMLPFLFYQQRNIKDQNQKFWKQLTSQKLKPIFVGTINFSLWLICLIYACRFTSMNHALCLSCLRFFLISAIKIVKKQRIHEFEIAGSILCTLGIILVMSDSITLPQVFGPTDEAYKKVQPWKRLVLGDGLGLIASLVSVYLDQHFTVPQMPKFTYLYLYNLFLSLNLMTSGYFFGGSEFDFNTKFGVFGLFTYSNFVNILYVSIMLGFYLVIVNILISQIFNDSILNASTSFQLILTSIAWHLLGLQMMPTNMTCVGYAFITPGLIFIIGGQGALNNKQDTLNFQLYRSNEPKNTTYLQQASAPHQQLSQSCESPVKQKQKIFEKIPFQIILEQDESDVKNAKNQ